MLHSFAIVKRYWERRSAQEDKKKTHEEICNRFHGLSFSFPTLFTAFSVLFALFLSVRVDLFLFHRIRGQKQNKHILKMSDFLINFHWLIWHSCYLEPKWQLKNRKSHNKWHLIVPFKKRALLPIFGMIKAVSRVSIFEHIMFINCTIATSICYNSFIYNPKFFNCIHFELACYFDTDVEIIRLQRRKKQRSYTYLTRKKSSFRSALGKVLVIFLCGWPIR